MDEDKRIYVDLVFVENQIARMERVNKRWFLAWLITFVLLVATNFFWTYREMQFEDVVVTQENDSGYNSYIGNDGTIIYGETND